MSSWISDPSDVAYLSVCVSVICYSVTCTSGINLSDYLYVCKCMYVSAQHSYDKSRRDLEEEDFTEAN